MTFSFTANYSTGLSASVGTLDGNTWTGNATTLTFTNANSDNTQIRFTAISVTTTEEVFAVTNVALRFGVIFPKADWNAIYEQWSISDYGVMIAKKETLNTIYDVDTIADAYHNGEYLLDLHKKTYAEPWSMDEDNYAFSVKLKMTSVSSYAITYCATPYIVANGTYYFLDQIETSVNDLAGDYLDNGGSTLSNEVLTLLSTTH